METGKVLSVIDEITEAGCLNLLITGGEPLMHRDFGDIYRHAKMKGLLLTVFTNGTLIDETVIGLFRELPPQVVEISIYGASEETSEEVTGVKSSFGKCLQGIERLLANGIRVKLKTILMTLNTHEFYAMEQFARGYGVKFRFDAGIFPRLNGDRRPLDFRVSVEDAVAKEFSDSERLQSWRQYFERCRSLPVPETLYVCSAGVTNFHIDAYGRLQPCIMPTDISYDLSAGSFQQGWEKVISRIMEKKATSEYQCNGCEQRSLCGFCPAFFGLENDSEELRSDYLCEMGRQRGLMLYNIVEIV
jgi:radical SAM protein with 4Fe4S-binding SPASM domain